MRARRVPRAARAPIGRARPGRSGTLALRPGRRTSASGTLIVPHVGEARPSTGNTRHNSPLYGVGREVPVPAFVSRTPTPAGARLRFGGRGRIAPCHRSRDADTPP